MRIPRWIERRLARPRVRRWRRPAYLGTIRRTTPLSRKYGRDRGTAIDRRYIDGFVRDHAGDLRGRALEVREPGYLERFGAGALDSIDVIDIDPTNRQATIVGDLGQEGMLGRERFDVMVITQTLQYVSDLPAAIRSLHQGLAPGGVLLATVPGIAQGDPLAPDVDRWRFTVPGTRALFEPVFGPDALEVRARGNVLSAVAFLMGMALEELRPDELETEDPAYPLVITIRARKAGRPA